MPPCKDAFTEYQLKRWMRPDAHNFVRPDWRRFVRPGFEHDHPFERYERKYSPDQPRDGHGRWTDGPDSSSPSDNSGKPGQRFSARISPEREAECELLSRQDTFKCNLLGTTSCWRQAAFRYAQCLNGGYVPPLYF